MPDEDAEDITEDVRERIGESNDIVDAIEESEDDDDSDPLMTHG